MPKQAALLKGAEPGCEIDIVMSARAEMTMDVSDQPDPDLEARVAAALAARRACEEHETVSSAVFFFFFLPSSHMFFREERAPPVGVRGGREHGTRAKDPPHFPHSPSLVPVSLNYCTRLLSPSPSRASLRKLKRFKLIKALPREISYDKYLVTSLYNVY